MNSEENNQWVRFTRQSAKRPVVWLLDIDDTLIDTQSMHHHAADSLTDELTTHMPKNLAVSVSRRFREVFDELLLVHQQTSGSDTNKLDSLKELESRVYGYQSEIHEEWGFTRLFSREILLRIAIEDCGASLRPDELRRCTDEYWDHMRENPVIFPDAARLTQKLATRETPAYLMTSSDARYREKINGQFTYDPQESREDKSRRVTNLKNHGIYYSGSFIGDPIDKPTVDFYNLVLSGIAHDLDRPLGSFSVVVVGDSYRSDIQTPLRLIESAIGILYRRGQPAIEVAAERVLSVGDFDMFIKNIDQSNGGERR